MAVGIDVGKSAGMVLGIAGAASGFIHSGMCRSHPGARYGSAGSRASPTNSSVAAVNGLLSPASPARTRRGAGGGGNGAVGPATTSGTGNTRANPSTRPIASRSTTTEARGSINGGRTGASPTTNGATPRTVGVNGGKEAQDRADPRPAPAPPAPLAWPDPPGPGAPPPVAEPAESPADLWPTGT
ncbi:hypothetical protein GCM10010171_35600 [Actinokineospora fastidiosa]|uniref:Uncharacterized protein n=1 Tax=Actinokineospora fastidiosa TaxID=1816 RepID=A0A918GI67_9PSEU|nr:hypothetical protein GCM10010171_35600 [Actinokineospora fastidiosa]